MMKWIAQRFRYTRDLEREKRLLHILARSYEGQIEYWKKRQSEFSKMTISEIEETLSACVDYQRCLIKLRAGDPIQHRVLPIFEKYNIAVERNTATDKVVEEAQEYLKKVEEEEK